jgi:predicted O-methyltransferase YrrM
MRIINGLRRRWRDTRIRWWKRARIASFYARHKERPCPLETWVTLQHKSERLLGYPDPLFPPAVIRKGRCLSDPGLSKLLAEEDIGQWSPQVDAIDFLVRLIGEEKPRRVLEFGSGLTTMCLAVALTRLHGPDKFRLLSIDQDAENIERASQRLQSLPGMASCRLVHVPLKPAVVEGIETSHYNFEALDPQHFVWLGKADFVFIDGPFATGPCRYNTLPSVRPHLQPGARFIYDDALRGKGALIARLWDQQGIRVEGVITVGQGFMVGRARI